MKLLSVFFTFLILLTQSASAEDRIFCTIAGAWKGSLVYEWDTYFYAKSVDECLCAARNEVIGTRFEEKTAKVRVWYLYSGTETIHKKVYTTEQLKAERACERISSL